MTWLRRWKYKRQHKRNIILPSPKDDRDFKYTRVGSVSTTTDIDLRPVLSDVRNQGSINCCFAFAGSSLIEALMLEKTAVKYVISPSYNYYFTRLIEGTYPANVGCYIRNYLKSIYNNGFVWESLMPFKNKSFYEPSEKALNNGSLVKELFLSRTSYVSVSPSLYLNALKNNKPLLLGLIINSSWYNVGSDGIISDLAVDKGGHAVLLCGRKKIEGVNYAIIKNSWGEKFGDDGYAYIPWNHLLSYSFDAWTISFKE